jgi:hypothetical protein
VGRGESATVLSAWEAKNSTTTKRRRRQTPIALLWTRRDQLRFTDAVERLVSIVNDLVVVVGELKKERVRRRPTKRPVNAPAESAPAGEVSP